MNRRQLLASTGLAAAVGWSDLLAPVKAVAAEVNPVRIKNIEAFTIELPAKPVEVEAGVMSRMGVTRVTTESGVRGYSFGNGGGGGRGGRGGGGNANAGTVPGRIGTPAACLFRVRSPSRKYAMR